jgi:hypothetical protein
MTAASAPTTVNSFQFFQLIGDFFNDLGFLATAIFSTTAFFVFVIL